MLARFDLRLEPGRRIALVGPSGAGKTTVTNLLLRFLDPERGRVTIGGRDVRELRQHDVRRTFAIAGQSAHIFNSTIRANLALARPEATDAELEDALDRGRLGEWVASLPDGLDTLVGEEGAQLSGGQRQRLTVARALLSDAPVLVLDEPTAHLDPETAEAARARHPGGRRRPQRAADHAPAGRSRPRRRGGGAQPGQVSGRDQSAATSPPPSWARRLPKRRNAGCGEIRPAASDSPCRNVVARSSRLSGTKEKTSPT